MFVMRLMWRWALGLRVVLESAKRHPVVLTHMIPIMVYMMVIVSYRLILWYVIARPIIVIIIIRPVIKSILVVVGRGELQDINVEDLISTVTVGLAGAILQGLMQRLGVSFMQTDDGGDLVFKI